MTVALNEDLAICSDGRSVVEECARSKAEGVVLWLGAEANMQERG
jgi:hypothetical protein